MSDERQPTYEELKARVAELEAAEQLTTWRLQRLAALENPRDKVILGVWEQVHAAGLADRRGTYIASGGELAVVGMGPDGVDRNPEIRAAMAANVAAPELSPRSATICGQKAMDTSEPSRIAHCTTVMKMAISRSFHHGLDSTTP